MMRGLMEHALSKSRIDQVFRENAEIQEEWDLLFFTVVDTLALAVTKRRPSVNAAYLSNASEFSVSVTSLYNKLDGVEPRVARALLQESARALEPVVRAMDPTGVSSVQITSDFKTS